MKLIIQKKDRNKGGIYCIFNSINDKVYIGSTVKFQNRFLQHRSSFTLKTHNKRFQNFVNKYGIKTLSMKCIEICEKEVLLEREQYWIDYYQSFKSKKGFNICKKSNSQLGVKMPKTHREACRKRMLGNTNMKGRTHSKEAKDKLSKISKDNWSVNRVKMLNACKEAGLKRRGVKVWDKFPHPGLNKPSKIRKPVLVFKDNILIDELPSTVDTALKYNLDPAAISKVCNGKSKSSKGYTFQYKQ